MCVILLGMMDAACWQLAMGWLEPLTLDTATFENRRFPALPHLTTEGVVQYGPLQFETFDTDFAIEA